MKIKVILNDTRKSKSGLYPIKIRVTQQLEKYKTKIKYVPVGVSVLPNQFDKKQGRVNSDKHPNAAAINLKIIEIVNQIERNFINDGIAAIGDKQDFYWWFDEWLNLIKVKYSVYHWKKINTMRNKLKSFAPTLTVKGLTAKFLSDFEIHLRQQNYHNNYIADAFVRLKTLTKTILKAGAIEYKNNPFNNFSVKFVKTNKERLKRDEVEALKHLVISKQDHEAVALAVDMYLVSFNCAGIRFGDICRLKTSHVLSSNFARLKYIAHKSSNERNIKLTADAKKILQKYISSFTKKELMGDPYIFDTKVIWATKHTKEAIDNEDKSINARNTFYNKKLRQACKLAGIPEITFHSSRNTLADLAVESGVGNDLVAMKNILGHSRISTTEQYMKSFYTEHADAAMDIIFKAKK